MPTATGEVTGAARDAVAGACEEVRDAGPDDAVDGTPARLVALPATDDEVSGVLRAAAAHDLAVVPRGRGTKLGWGRPPTRAEIVLDLSRMDAVVDHAAGDLIVEARAGTPLETVQAHVAGAGQRLALDAMLPGATVGGALAAGTSGPGRVATGTLRDLLIGVTVVRADGARAMAGGRVVKNVAGYDLGKLVHGSFGTLAVVTQAVFRLHPLPAARRFVSVPVDGPARAHELNQAVVHSQVVPGAVELDVDEDGRGHLTVLLEGTGKGVAGRTDTTLALLGGDASVAEQPPRGWATYPWSAGGTALKLTCALTGLPDVLDAARTAPAPVAVRGSAGAGVLYAALPPGTPAEGVAQTVDVLRAAATRHGGAAVVLDAPAPVKQAVDTWGPVPALHLMRRVKDQFDPGHRLSPGRFVGGI